MSNINTSQVHDKKDNISRRVLRFLSKYYLIFTLALIFIVSSFLSPNFLTSQNLINIAIQNAMISIIAFGMLFVIVTGGIDLSVGSVMALSVCLCAGLLKQGMPVPIAILVIILVTGLCGAVSGGLVAFGGIEPFIATLAMQTIIRGITYMYQVGSVSVIENQSFLLSFGGNLGPIPVPIIYMIIIAAGLGFVLRKTTFGRRVYSIGGNKEAARLVGISVPKTIIFVYVLAGMLTGFAGVLTAARLRVGTALVGVGTEVDAIAAVVIGGAAFSGGRGNIVNTLIGAFILGIIGNIMNLMDVATYPQMMIKGVIIVIAVLARGKSSNA